MGIKGLTCGLSAAALVFGAVGCEHLFHHHDDDDKNEVEINFDDTELGALPNDWTVAETAGKGKTAKWRVVEDKTAPSGKKALYVKSGNSGHTFNLIIAEKMEYKDLEVEVKVKAVKGKQDQGGGPIWRVQDADNYYVARWNPLEDNFRIYYVKNGKRRQIASANIKADPKKWHEIEIKHIGDKIIAEFDDKKVIEVENAIFPQAGKVGLWTKADASSKFDDFKVELEEEDDD
jgi:hypothetical protein